MRMRKGIFLKIITDLKLQFFTTSYFSVFLRNVVKQICVVYIKRGRRRLFSSTCYCLTIIFYIQLFFTYISACMQQLSFLIPNFHYIQQKFVFILSHPYQLKCFKVAFQICNKVGKSVSNHIKVVMGFCKISMCLYFLKKNMVFKRKLQF